MGLLSLAVAAGLITAMLVPLAVVKETKAWSADPATNTPICTVSGDQDSPRVISDGFGGAIIIWQDLRYDSDDIYGQRVGPSGETLWDENGVTICGAANGSIIGDVQGDGSGGAIVVWTDGRSGDADIYAQRVDGSGMTLWTDEGTAICTASGAQTVPGLVADESGGAIIAWSDNRSGNWDVYAQRVSSSGAPLWTGNGIAICKSTGDQIVTGGHDDGDNGAIITWQDERSGNWDVYAQRVSSSGTPLWTGNGASVCTAAGDQGLSTTVSDGSGGAIVVWTDERYGVSDGDVYAQRIGSSGTPLWTSDGVAICSSTGYQMVQDRESDGSGGIVVVWTDTRSGDSDVYAQRVSSSGTTLWTDDGVEVGAGEGDQTMPSMAGDGSGGLTVVWMDTRSGESNIYAQRLDALGTQQWTENGVAICTAAYEQKAPSVDSDGWDGVIIAWADRRDDIDFDIWAQKLNSSGLLAGMPNQPVNLSPTDGATSTTLSPILQASPFSDGDAEDTHAASQWQVRSTSTDYSNATFDSGSNSSNLTSITTCSLSDSTTYFWHVRYQDNNGDWSAWSAETSFTTLNPSPSVTTDDASSIGTNSVQLNGTVTSMGLDTSVSVSFEWRVSGGAFTPIGAGDVNSTGAYSANLVGLAPGTVYYYRAKADGYGKTAWGMEKSFATVTIPAVPATPPTVASDACSTINTSSTRVNGNLTSLGTSSTVSVSFQWGTTSGHYDYETAPEMRTSTGTFYSDLSGLSPGATYYYRAKAEGDGEPVYSPERSFTTGMPAGQSRNSPPVWVQLLAGAGAISMVGAVALVTNWKLAGVSAQKRG